MINNNNDNKNIHFSTVSCTYGPTQQSRELNEKATTKAGRKSFGTVFCNITYIDIFLFRHRMDEALEWNTVMDRVCNESIEFLTLASNGYTRKATCI